MRYGTPNAPYQDLNIVNRDVLRNDWQGVVVYPTRSIDTAETVRYRELLNPARVKRIYLDELGESLEQSIGIETVKLVIADEQIAVEQARELLDRVRLEIANEVRGRELIQLIETILVYKFPQKSWEEIEAMFGFRELKQTRVYQEALQEARSEARLEARIEGLLESVPALLALGLSVEQIAEALGLDIEQVKQAAQQQPSD